MGDTGRRVMVQTGTGQKCETLLKKITKEIKVWGCSLSGRALA
jgi:hypothetical protein